LAAPADALSVCEIVLLCLHLAVIVLTGLDLTTAVLFIDQIW